MRRSRVVTQVPSGLTPIWLFGLALILGVGITVCAPMISSPDPVKLSDWFGFAGSFGGAIVTLMAAWKAWSAVQIQVQQTERLESQRRRQKHAALRAVLPIHLSELSTYCLRSGQALLTLHNQCIGEELPYRTEIAIPSFPGLPAEVIKSVAEFIEYSDDVDASIFQKTIARLQVHNARIGEVRYIIETQAAGEMILKGTLEQYIIDAATVYAGAASVFDYARHRTNGLLNDITWESVRSALRNMKIWDDDVPSIFATITRLEVAGLGP